jgi:protein-tyrosine phosphatase
LSARVFGGLVNFRDLGGLPAAAGAVAPGRLFRSDALNHATPEDADHLIDVLGIVTVVDLRESREVAEFGRGPMGERGVRYIEMPIGDVPNVSTRSEFYAGVIGDYGPAIAGLVRALVQPGVLPAVVHCHIGCDRTGAVSAAILLLLGVDEKSVAADYAESRRANDRIQQRARDRRTLLGLPQMDAAYYEAWDPRPEIMMETLRLIRDRWGSIDGWAKEVGLEEADIAALRAALIVS